MIPKVIKIVSPLNQNIEEACNQITFLIIHLITAKKVIILKVIVTSIHVSDIFI